MDKKFELTEANIEWDGHILHRIKALKDFGNVKKGDMGGFVESEDNLSQDGDCWIYYYAKVYGNAKVFGAARVYAHAQVHGNAKVFDNANVCGDTQVFDSAVICDDAIVSDNAKVFGNAKI